MPDLILYSRVGCCLCKGLEQRLVQLDLTELSCELRIVDIDARDTPSELRMRFNMEVPVLSFGNRILPRVPPRLNGEVLFNWLTRTLSIPQDSSYNLSRSGKTNEP